MLTCAGTVLLGSRERRRSSRRRRFDLARLALHGDVVVERRPVRSPRRGGHLLAAAGRLPAGDRGRARPRSTDLVLAASTAGRSGSPTSSPDAGPSPWRWPAPTRSTPSRARPNPRRSRSGGARRSGLRRVATSARPIPPPLLAHELDAFDGVVFDPPRAGREAQARQLAESKVSVVVGVACDTGTFARDAATLSQGATDWSR